MLVRTVALAFGALGLLFIALPVPASVLFGIKADSDTALAYVRALGIRDVALCLYLLGVSTLSARSLRALLGFSVVIPAGDLALVFAMSGFRSPVQLALHALSGICLALLQSILVVGPWLPVVLCRRCQHYHFL